MNNIPISSFVKRNQSFIFIVAVFAVLGWAIYANVLNGEFVSDDYPYIVDNFAVRNIADLQGLWHSGNTRFLVMVTFALNYHWQQLNTSGYHLVNIFIHVINALLVYCLVILTLRMPAMRAGPLQKNGASLAFYAGLIFLCHPIQTQAVSYITQRATSMACFFYLCTLILYIKFRLEGKLRYSVAAWLAMFLGILTKEMVLTIPLAIIVYEFYFGDRFPGNWKKVLRDSLPFFILSGLLALIFMQDRSGSVLGLKGQLSGRSFSWVYFLTEINVLRTYLRLLFLPINQNHHYDYPAALSFLEPLTFFSFFLLGAVCFLAVALFRKHRLLSFAICWFFIATAVEFVVVCFVNRGVLYEHWLYLPMVGFAIFIAAVIHTVLRRQEVQKAIVIFIIVVMCVLTYVRNFVWQTEIGFWDDVVKKSPQAYLVYLGSGTAYLHKGMMQEAGRHYQKGLQLFFEQKHSLRDIDRTYLSRIFNNLGLVLQSMGQDKEAVLSFRRAYKIDPSNASVYRNLAKYCLDKGRYRQAIFFLKEEMKLAKDDPNVYYGFGLAFLRLQEKEKARAFFDKSRQLERVYGNQSQAEKLAQLINKL